MKLLIIPVNTLHLKWFLTHSTMEQNFQRDLIWDI